MKFVIVALLLAATSSHGFQSPRMTIDIRGIGAINPRQIITMTIDATWTKPKTAQSSIPLVEPFLKGLKRDIKTKLPFYISDFVDGISIKTLSTSFFLFFACLAPAVAFGGLLAGATGGAMGTVEAVGATAIGGILYALFSAQPLTIIGTTGPLLAFLAVLCKACQSLSLPFLPVYAWVGLWSSLMLFFSSFFSLSNVVSYFTRFTDDIFSSLISVIFIYEAVKDIVGNFANPAVSGLKASISLIVAISTYSSIKLLAGIRKTPFFPRRIRNRVADFAPTVGVALGVYLSQLLGTRYDCALKMLSIPNVLGSTSGRPWLVDIFSLPLYYRLLCFFPALMATVLLFMDQNITVRLMMAKENKLKKDSGLHLDMFVVAVVTAITSMLGMPWMVAATVRSLAHLRSLQLFSNVGESLASTTAPPTEAASSNLVVTGVLEQRATGLLIHSLIAGALIAGRDALRAIPVAVTTGLFLFLGVSSIGTTDLFARTKLFITDEKDLGASGKTISKYGTSLDRTKLFTFIQLLLLGAMWWIKGTRFGVFFPVLIGVLAPIRIALEKFGVFKSEELEKLDGEIA